MDDPEDDENFLFPSPSSSPMKALLATSTDANPSAAASSSSLLTTTASDSTIQVGKGFDSFEEADIYIRRYSMQNFFRVGIKETRYLNKKKKECGIRSIRYQCSRAGKTRVPAAASSTKTRRKRSLKCECPFSITVAHFDDVLPLNC